ncbi:MAG: PDZ domain-containing protein [Planctomycetes bacterium]|nr:PDZ domain-containing protein [Planctomycetota bacterium]
MRAAGFALYLALSLVAAAPAAEPTNSDLLFAIEKQLRVANELAGPTAACVVVSRSDRYPKPATDAPGKLGRYDIKEFLKANPTEERVAKELDLADVRTIADHGYACGVVVDPAGLILTPYHVVEGATKVYVHLPGRVGSYADVHAADGRHDLAVLKLLDPPAKLTAIKFADVRRYDRDGARASVFAGKLAVVMANGYSAGTGVDRPSSSFGSVTRVIPSRGVPDNATVRKSDDYYYYGPFLQYEAKVTTAVSGAALLNLDGELIGLTTTSAMLGGNENAPQLTFVADECFRRVVEVLRRGEEVEYGYLGVTLVGINDTRPSVTIGDTIAQGPAAVAGLERGDTITAVNGVPIQTYEDLLVYVGSELAGTKVKLTVTRARRDRDANVTVTLGKLRNPRPVIASVRPDPVFGLRVDHGSVLAQQLSDQKGGEVRTSVGVPPGVMVRELVPNSQAATAFKKLGERPERWLITQVNGATVATPTDFYKAAKGQANIKLTVRDPSEQNPRDHEVTIP